MSLSVEPVPLLSDNYAYLLTDSATGKTAIVDPSEDQPVISLLAQRGLKLSFILNTHHHADHSGGNLGIKQATGAKVVGSAADAHRLPGLDIGLGDGESWSLGDSEARIILIPGHTSGHIAFWFRADDALFSGDTLFACGCGRMFEGNPKQMWGSLSRLRALPAATRVFCGHEYTQANARFAKSVDPKNPALARYAARVDQLRAEGKPTTGSTLGDEIEANPFLRADDPAMAEAMGMAGADPSDVFAAIRKAKDQF